ncbi:MAG: hypothetical protein JSW06_01660 [Thermoplasmatales archaeon]|nr:MAG: hypothetical protein JSW06_01660 [Thermoplasmatales archaeon]
MNKNHLLKKGIVFTVIVMLIGLTFTSASVSKRDISTRKMSTNKHGINFQIGGDIFITVDPDAISEPIEPLSGYRLVPVNVSYAIRGLLAGKLLPIIKKRCSHMPIYLSIKNRSEWADAIILPDIVYPEISTEYKSDTTNLFISIVNKSAFAFTGGYILIEAKTKPLLGPLGLITWINPRQEVSQVGFIPDYYPLISVTPENDTIETPPGEPVELPITIKNLGNAITRIDFDKLEYPDDWGVLIPSIITLTINQEIQVSLVLRSPQNFIGNQTIRLALTPDYYGYNYKQGVTEFISILAYYPL